MRDHLIQATSMLAMGELVVYPTDTVYGLGADAIAADAVERVYELKGRSRDDPLSMAVPDVDAALEHVTATEREEAFMRAFLPGPVTVVLERQSHVPDALTAGDDRVGIRIPDHDLALDMLDEFAPVTATSANRSGEANATTPGELDDAIREGVGAVVDSGELPGGESTVVDPGADEIHRRGRQADDVHAWLDDH
ncbi:tRNA(ANN) t(6)A37 threonylcarbamoyladenosine modification protein [Halolamina pelagica]|uniref:L-threonylcarbamoyladenylate synthase n=1 Tax=Halolamina pelagica TaxID=699431 RepID=A0A0P7H7Z6_9EURY|nr:L-threonylcarbamoyladenylate synthase [Halolamina pelagica]KPN29582.1 tRNA(ANN) t(6)A37 threonylcarbamoyladenosine modification protein [Halolamina pelagica]